MLKTVLSNKVLFAVALLAASGSALSATMGLRSVPAGTYEVPGLQSPLPAGLYVVELQYSPMQTHFAVSVTIPCSQVGPRNPGSAKTVETTSSGKRVTYCTKTQAHFDSLSRGDVPTVSNANGQTTFTIRNVRGANGQILGDGRVTVAGSLSAGCKAYSFASFSVAAGSVSVDSAAQGSGPLEGFGCQ